MLFCIYAFKKKKKNVSNIFREAHPPNPKVHLPFLMFHFSRSGVQESVPTKKKEKRTLEMFSEKPIYPIPKFTYYSKRIQKAKGIQKAIPTKKKKRER